MGNIFLLRFTKSHCLLLFRIVGSFRVVSLFLLTGFYLHFAWCHFLFSLVWIFVFIGFARVHLACASFAVVSIGFCHLIREPFSVAMNAWFDVPCRFFLQEVSSFVKFIKHSYKFIFLTQIFYQQLDLVYIWWYSSYIV